MSWKDNLQRANFRGVDFFVDSAEFDGGNRTAIHSYPQRNEPLIEWLGRKVRTYRISGYLVGDDYAKQLNRLIKKFESPPPGFPHKVGVTMRHPYRGDLRVVGQDLRITESKSDGAFAKLDMTFVEAGREPGPPVSNGAQLGKAKQAELAAQEATTADLVENANTVGFAQQVRDAIGSGISAASNAMKSLDVFTGLAADVAAIGFKINAMTSTLAGLIAAPANLAATFTGVLDSIDAAVGNALGALAAYESVIGLEPVLTGGLSVADQAADANAILIADFMGTAAAGGAVRAAIGIEWESLEEALVVQARLATAIDGLLERANDNTYTALQDIRSALASGVPGLGQDLPSVQTLTLPGSTPALVLASRLYDDPLRGQAIVDRNRVRHPLFLPGQTGLEVLSE
jgi:prophage DNA circulation protein